MGGGNKNRHRNLFLSVPLMRYYPCTYYNKLFLYRLGSLMIVILVLWALYSCFEIPVFQNLKSRQFVFQSKHHLFEFLIDQTVLICLSVYTSVNFTRTIWPISIAYWSSKARVFRSITTTICFLLNAPSPSQLFINEWLQISP